MADRAGWKDPRRIVVVGPCAAGKSTLVAGLVGRGYRAMACGQEHSEIPTLWQHLKPDLVIALDLDLATLSARRGRDWPEQLYRAQRKRLARARAAADLVIDTSRLTPDAVLELAVRLLEAPPHPHMKSELQPSIPSRPDLRGEG